MNTPQTAVIALGSNLDNPAEKVQAALQAALDLLQTGGLLLAVLYPGHEAGRQEAEAVEAWAQALPQQQYTVLRYAFANRRNQPPYLLALEKIHA